MVHGNSLIYLHTLATGPPTHGPKCNTHWPASPSSVLISPHYPAPCLPTSEHQPQTCPLTDSSTRATLILPNGPCRIICLGDYRGAFPDTVSLKRVEVVTVPSHAHTQWKATRITEDQGTMSPTKKQYKTLTPTLKKWRYTNCLTKIQNDILK